MIFVSVRLLNHILKILFCQSRKLRASCYGNRWPHADDWLTDRINSTINCSNWILEPLIQSQAPKLDALMSTPRKPGLSQCMLVLFQIVAFYLSAISVQIFVPWFSFIHGSSMISFSLYFDQNKATDVCSYLYASYVLNSLTNKPD